MRGIGFSGRRWWWWRKSTGNAVGIDGDSGEPASQLELEHGKCGVEL
jgi:hypothetical protein